MVKVTIVMPMLNSIEYLKDCMDSVVNQTLKDIEIIVVDAGSTDGTIECIEQYMKNDNRISLLKSDKKSMGKQYNMGIDVAIGEYIGFCESDDRMALDACEILYQKAIEHNLEYVKGDYSHFFTLNNEDISLDMMSGLVDKYNIIINPSEEPELCLADGFMWNGIYRKDFLIENSIILNESFGAAYQDSGFVQQIHMKSTRAMHISQNVYYYRKDNEGASVRSNKTMQFVFDEYEFIMKIIKNNGCKREHMKPYMIHRYFDLFTIECRKNYQYVDEQLVENFKNIILEDYKTLANTQKLEIFGRDSFVWSMFLENTGKYIDFCKGWTTSKQRLFDAMCDEIGKYKEVVIWGCGELGQLFSYMFQGRGIKNIVAATDNNAENWGKKMCGIEIISPEQTFKCYKEAYYVITPVKYRFDIKLQLLRNSILEEQIYMPIGINHSDIVSCLYDRSGIGMD